MATYGVRDGYRVKGDAQDIGDELEALKKRHKGVKHDVIWKSARAASSPLHAEFTWNVQEAAEKRWSDEARYLVRAVAIITYRVEDTKKKEPIKARAFLSVPDDATAPRTSRSLTYHARKDVFRNKKYRAGVLKEAILYLKDGCAKYRELTELDHVWTEIDFLDLDDLLDTL